MTVRANASLLILPDDVLRNIFVYLLSPPPGTPALSAHTLPHSEDAFQLSATCTRLRRVFQTSVTSLHMPWNSPVYPHTLARMFGKSLRELCIHHTCAGSFLKQFAMTPTSLRSLALYNCPVPDNVFKKIIQGTSLRELTLDFVYLATLNDILISIAPHLTNVRLLHLHGMSKLSSTAFLTVLRACGSTLRDLSLNYMRHNTITNEVLLQIYDAAPGLSSLALTSLRHTTLSSTILKLCSLYGTQLKSLTLCHSRINEYDFCELLTSCPKITNLDIDEPWNTPQVSTVITAIQQISEQLCGMHIRNLSGLRDVHVQQLLVTQTKVSLRRHHMLTDSSVFHVSKLGTQLKSLDLRGCLFTDVGLRSLANCSNLSELLLGTDGEDVSERLAAELGSRAVTNAGIEVMLRGCGRVLQKFRWSSPRVAYYLGMQYEEAPGVVGVSQLTSRGIIKSIHQHCPKIHTVELDGLHPYKTRRQEWARLELDVMALEESVGRVIVLVNDRPLC